MKFFYITSLGYRNVVLDLSEIAFSLSVMLLLFKNP